MKIYIKISDGVISEIHPSEITTDIVGICVENNGTFAHYIFTQDSESKKLRRYFVRIFAGERVGASLYYVYNEKKGCFDSTPNQDEQAKKIPDNSIFLTDAEINTLVTTLTPQKIQLNCMYLETSPLTRRQQNFLYSGLVTGIQAGMTFREYMQKNILEGANAIKILQASISQNGQSFFEKESDEYSELLSFQFAFLAPNNIVRFSESLQTRTKYQATVGDIIDFYTHCIQTQLKKMKAACVLEKNIRRLSAVSRAVLRGDIAHDFGPEGIYNLQGLKVWEYTVFQALIRIIETQAQDNNIHSMKRLLMQDNFKTYHCEIHAAVVDMINSIYQKTRTTLTDYVTVMDDVCASYPQPGWKNFLSHLRHAEHALLMCIDAVAVLEKTNLPIPIRKKIHDYLVEYHKEEGEAGFAEILILLHRASLLSKENARVVLLSNQLTLVFIFDVLRFLFESQLLTKENFKMLVSFSDFRKLGDVMSALKLNGILNEAYFIAITKNTQSFNFISESILLLQDNYCLTREYCDALFSTASPANLFYILERLSDEEFDIKEVFETVTACEDHGVLNTALMMLDNAGILDHDNFFTLTGAVSLGALLEGMRYLQQVDLLDDENFNMIVKSKNPLGSARLLKVLANYREAVCDLFSFFPRNNQALQHFVTMLKAYIKSGSASDLHSIDGQTPPRVLRVSLGENKLLDLNGLFDADRLLSGMNDPEEEMSEDFFSTNYVWVGC